MLVLAVPLTVFHAKMVFDITVASGNHGDSCLATDIKDLNVCFSINIVVATVMTVHLFMRARSWNRRCATLFLKMLSKLNLVQTIWDNALVHGGPFANIAHGCNPSSTSPQRHVWQITTWQVQKDLALKIPDIKTQTPQQPPWCCYALLLRLLLVPLK